MILICCFVFLSLCIDVKIISMSSLDLPNSPLKRECDAVVASLNSICATPAKQV